jgi:hypothetical protein
VRFSRSGEGAAAGDSGGRSLKTQQHVGPRLLEGRLPGSVDMLGAPCDHKIDGRLLEQELPRKEVIQPHLPVRLPCYDFTPITSPTFDGSLPEGLGHRLRVLPAFVV